MIRLALAILGVWLLGHGLTAAAGKPSITPISRDAWLKLGHADRWVREFAADVRKVAGEFGLPPTPTDAFVTAHAAISSGWGRSDMTRTAFNAFGIKAGPGWKGPTVTTATKEYRADGSSYRTTATWRVYSSYADCIRDHLRMVMTASRYSSAALALRAGSDDYMAELGRGGWYTNIPAKVNAEWLAARRRVERVLAGGRVVA